MAFWLSERLGTHSGERHGAEHHPVASRPKGEGKITLHERLHTLNAHILHSELCLHRPQSCGGKQGSDPRDTDLPAKPWARQGHMRKGQSWGHGQV